MVNYYDKLPEGYSVDQFFRVQFYQYEIDADLNKHIHYYNTTYCKDMYANRTFDQIQQAEFSGYDFVCPDTDAITILNSPLLYQG